MATNSDIGRARRELDALMAAEDLASRSGDFSESLAAWSDDAWILPSMERKFIKGGGPVRKWIRTNALVPKYKRKLLRSEVTPTLAFQVFSYSGTNTASDGRSMKFEGFMTRVLMRVKSGWRIMHAVWRDVSVTGPDGDLITDLEPLPEGALSMGCGSQVGAYQTAFVTAPRNPQKPKRSR
ncbi:MAG: hypothetical protein AB7F36_01785 [Reyranellaceae bacterium]